MTVSELIEELQKHKGDATVLLWIPRDGNGYDIRKISSSDWDSEGFVNLDGVRE